MKTRTPPARRRTPVLLSTTLAFGVALGGCQSAGGGSGWNPFSSAADSTPTTPAERELQEDEERFNKTVISGVLLGAAGGALIGASVALIAGGNKRDAARGAAAGAVVGGAALGIDGYVTAKKEQEARKGIRATQAAANDVRQDNERLQAYLDTSDRVLAEGKARLTALRRDVAARKVSVEQANAARQRESRNIASMNETLKKARETRAQYAEAASKFDDKAQGKPDLDAEIRRMDAQIKQLEENIVAYNQALQVSRA